MIKVVFTDGSSYVFEDAEVCEHDKDHKVFLVRCKKSKAMIPDHHVAVVGLWDDKNKKFI